MTVSEHAETVSQDVLRRLCVSIRGKAALEAAEHSVLHNSHLELYKTCVDGTSLAVSAPGVVSRTVAVA